MTPLLLLLLLLLLLRCCRDGHAQLPHVCTLRTLAGHMETKVLPVT